MPRGETRSLRLHYDRIFCQTRMSCILYDSPPLRESPGVGELLASLEASYYYFLFPVWQCDRDRCFGLRLSLSKRGEQTQSGLRHMKSNDHGRVIAEAAKALLEPLGFRRKGRSRLWFSDQRIWLVNIEFQPSGFRKGSYLNAGAQWMWCAKSTFSFDTSTGFWGNGTGMPRFVSYESEQQFKPEVWRLATEAAPEAMRLRNALSSIEGIASHLEAQEQEPGERLGGWPLFHTAAATALAGNRRKAKGLFERVPAYLDNAGLLAGLLGDPAAFRSEILKRVERCRLLLRLRSDSGCLDHNAAH